MIAFDTEDDSQGTVAIINFYDGIRHTTFEGERCRLDAQNYLLEQAPDTVWACNTEYDLINLYGPWLAHACTIQYVKSGLLRASLRDAPILFYDTLRHWPMSVKQMGEYIGLPKLEQDFRSVKYCRRDTEIVWTFVSQMLHRYDRLGLSLKATLPSMALQLWRKDFYPHDIVPVPKGLIAYFRHGYYGGRVEVYRFGEIVGRTNHYDINALFPSVMYSQEYPNLKAWSVTNAPDFDKEGMATITLNIPETCYPPLPVRTAHGIVYPYGFITGTWCYPEIRQAITDGAHIYTVHNAVQFPGRVEPFKGYVDYCTSMRQQAGPKTLDDRFWKLMQNSLYGKFGQTDGLEVIHKNKTITLNASASHANVIWSAYVTCWARLVLLRHLRACSDVYYTDTDSLFTPDSLPTSGALGALKQEGCYTSCEFVGNKVYTVTGTRAGKNVTREAKAKGVPEASAADFIRTGRAVYTAPARFRASRRSFMRANVWYEFQKELLAEYAKRRRCDDGRTAPWRFDDFQKQWGPESVDLPALSLD